MSTVQNYMGLDLGAHKKIILDHSKYARTHHELDQPVTDGIVTAYFYCGVSQGALKPKKGEMELWTVELHTGVQFRIDTIVATATVRPTPEGAEVPKGI